MPLKSMKSSVLPFADSVPTPRMPSSTVSKCPGGAETRFANELLRGPCSKPGLWIFEMRPDLAEKRSDRKIKDIGVYLEETLYLVVILDIPVN